VKNHHSEFQLIPIKRVATINDEALGETTDPDFELQYIDIGNVNSNGNVHEIAVYRFEAAPSRARRIVRDGDVIISTVRTYLQAIAPINNPPENLIVSTGFAVVRPSTTKLDAGFCKYALHEPRFIQEVITRSTGVSYPAITAMDLADIPIFVPPLPKQRAIADYLDRETARLDTLIAAKEKLLEILVEKRAAIINQSVTNENAINSVQKDKSPAPWLFPLPSEWKRQPLKHISFTKGRIGYEELKAEEYTDEGPYLVSSAHFRDGKVEWERCNHVTRERFEMAPDIILRQHDVLFMKDGAAMGKLAYIDDLPGEACLNSHILVIRPLRESYLPKFLFYVLMTDVFKAYMEQERKGTTFFGFSEQSMGNFPMSFPSLSEQKEIVSSLEDRIKKIDRLAELANTTIEHLHERRASLIAAAVSGQIKVS